MTVDNLRIPATPNENISETDFYDSMVRSLNPKPMPSSPIFILEARVFGRAFPIAYSHFLFASFAFNLPSSLSPSHKLETDLISVALQAGDICRQLMGSPIEDSNITCSLAHTLLATLFTPCMSNWAYPGQISPP